MVQVLKWIVDKRLAWELISYRKIWNAYDVEIIEYRIMIRINQLSVHVD